MPAMQAFLDAIFMATLTLVVASADIIISDDIIAFTPSSTTGNTARAITITLDPNPTPNPSFNGGCSPCYCGGETWDQLGTWEEISAALQDSRIVKGPRIPGGYHVVEHIKVNDHCFVFEIGVNKGDALNMTPGKITNLLSAARERCAHGGRWDLKFVAGDGNIQGMGWVKADPQADKDCS